MNNDYNDREILFVSGEEAQLIRQAEQVDIIAAARSQKAAPKGTINPLITYETEAERAVIGKRMELERKYQLEKGLQCRPILVTQVPPSYQPPTVNSIVRYVRNAPSDMDLAQILLARVTLRRLSLIHI